MNHPHQRRPQLRQAGQHLNWSRIGQRMSLMLLPTLLLFTVSNPARGQERQTASQATQSENSSLPSKNSTPAKPPSVDVADTLINVEFPGGTLADYIEHLKHFNVIAGQPLEVNVLLDESVAGTQLPKISFKKVPLMAALRVVEMIRNESQQRIDLAYMDTIFVVSGRSNSPRSKPDDHQTMVLPARDILSELSQDDLFSAIEIGLNLEEPAVPVTLKLHQETGLLFARGRPTQLALISSVIQEIRGSQQREGGSPRRPTHTPDGILVPPGKPNLPVPVEKPARRSSPPPENDR